MSEPSPPEHRWHVKPIALSAAIIVLLVIGFLWYRNEVDVPDEVGDGTEFVTWVDRGLSEEIKVEFELRITTLEAAISSNPERDISQLLQLGNLKYTYGDLQGAKEQYEDILFTHPKDAPALENLGQTLREMGDYEGAFARWRAALNISPYEVTYLKLADLIEEQFPERQDEIQTLLEEAIATLGQTPGLLKRLGEWYATNEQYDEAISHYKVAKQLDPDDETIDELIDEVRAAKAQAAKEERE